MRDFKPVEGFQPQEADRVLETIQFNEQGLVPAIAQDHVSHQVLMLAWMNADSIRETLKSGWVTYWSRSRSSMWRKGETSGHVQRLVRFSIDCDGDTLLLIVDQEGPACHLGKRSCFFREAKDKEIVQ